MRADLYLLLATFLWGVWGFADKMAVTTRPSLHGAMGVFHSVHPVHPGLVYHEQKGSTRCRCRSAGCCLDHPGQCLLHGSHAFPVLRPALQTRLHCHGHDCCLPPGNPWPGSHPENGTIECREGWRNVAHHPGGDPPMGIAAGIQVEPPGKSGMG